MKRFAIVALATAAMAATAHAQSANCDRDFKDFWEKMSPAAKQLTGKQLADTARIAVRGYDACSAGDERFNASNFFDKLSSPNVRPDDLFQELDRQRGGAKK
jgi:hypothetical protein